MKNYITQFIGKQGNKCYAVLESNTGNIVSYQVSSYHARKKAAFLNTGGGFDGFTPVFICENVR